MAGSIFSNFGLISQGSDAADMERERIRNAKQYNDLDPQRRAIVDQQIQSGEMTLGEARRQRDTAAAERAAVSKAGNLSGAYDAAIKARLAAGNLEAATSSYAAADELKRRTALQFAADVHNGIDPNKAAERLQGVGLGADLPVGQLQVIAAPAEADPKFAVFKSNHPEAMPGDRYVSSPVPGGRQLWNVSRAVRMAAPKAEIHPAGEWGTFIDKGGETKFVPPQAQKTFAPHTLSSKVEKVTVKDAEGGERTYLWNLETHDWEGDKPPAGTAIPTDRNAGKVLPELKEVTNELMKIPGMATRSNPADPLDTQLVYTEKGAKIAPVVSGLIMADRKLTAHEAILVAMNGVRGVDADGNLAIKYGDKIYKMSDSAGKKVVTKASVPTAEDKSSILNKELKENQDNLVKAQKEGDSNRVERLITNIDQLNSELAKIAKPIRPAPTATTVKPVAPLPVIPPVAQSSAPAAPAQSAPVRSQAEIDVMIKNAKVGYQPAVKYLKELLASGELQVGQRMRVQQALKESGAKGYSKGGKVSRYQRRGLGA